MPDLIDGDEPAPADVRKLRTDEMRFRADADRIQLQGTILRIGDNIKQLLTVLSLRRNRAETLTQRIHVLFCALAASRVYRPDGWLSMADIGKLDGWARTGSLAKLVINEFDISGDGGIVEQRGRGNDAQLRLRMPPAFVDIGDLPDGVRRLFVQERQAATPIDDVRPQPVVDWNLAVTVANALRAARPGDRTLLVSPLYQGGHSSLVFGGLALRALGSTRGRPVATSVLVKIPLGVSARNKLAIHEQTLDNEIVLLSKLAGWPGLPASVERAQVDLRASGSLLWRHGMEFHRDSLVMDALIIPLGHPRTIEAEPRLLSSIIDDATSPRRRLTRRDLHNILTLAERLARLLRMLHRERRAHRHLSVDAITVRYELGIFENILAPDLAASVKTSKGSDDLLYRDLFDLGRVLVHVITGAALSRERQNFQPPEFQGRRLLKNAVVGEGETVARLLFGISRYLLEASAGTDDDNQHDEPTVLLLDHFLDEIEHIDMLHWARARGVPERRVSLASATATSLQSSVSSREVWARSAADPVATRLVTISHLVDVPTLRRWCERYVTSFTWQASSAARRDAVSGNTPLNPSVERCLAILRQGFGRSAAAEMWRYLWTADPDEPADKLVRILRNYATHWTREGRFDISHPFEGRRHPDGRTESSGLGDELDALRQISDPLPNRKLLVDWIDGLRWLRPRSPGETKQRRDGPAERAAAERAAAEPAAEWTPAWREYERLRSWLRAGALMRQLRSKTIPPAEKDIYALERTLQARSSPEIAFWHILLARAWALSAAHEIRAETADDDRAWDKAMRALIVAAGVAASRKLPFEMAVVLETSASLTRLGLSTPELRAEFASQGVDDESVRVQAAECALQAADAYQWLDTERPHWKALLEATRLLQGSAFPERLIQAFQLLSLARNNRILCRAPQDRKDDSSDPSMQFERYPLAPDDDEKRTVRERMLFEEMCRAWRIAPGRLRTSDDPGVVVAHGYFARYAAGTRLLFKSSKLSSSLQIEFDDDPDKPVKAVDQLFELVNKHYQRPIADRILDFGCGPGDDARYLAENHKVWAVDSPVWFAVSRVDAPSAGKAPRFIEMDPVEYANRVCGGEPPDGSPTELDVVLFRCSLCRISERALLLKAAHKLLRPGGLVVATDWVQTRVTNRITWSKLVGTGRFVDLETEPGYRRLCAEHGFTEFVSWDWAEQEPLPPGAEPERDVRAPAMYRWFQRRLEEVRRLEDERSGPRRSPYERAFLLRLKRDLEAFTALSTPDGPLGWVFWAARKPLP